MAAADVLISASADADRILQPAADTKGPCLTPLLSCSPIQAILLADSSHTSIDLTRSHLEIRLFFSFLL